MICENKEAFKKLTLAEYDESEDNQMFLKVQILRLYCF